MRKYAIRIGIWLLLMGFLLLQRNVVYATEGTLMITMPQPSRIYLYRLHDGENEIPEWMQSVNSAETVKKAEQYVRKMGIESTIVEAEAVGILCIEHLPQGIYYIEMEEPEIQSFIVGIPTEGSYVIHATPKAVVGEELPPVSELPQTGLLRWPIPVLSILGCLSLWIGFRKRR